MSEFLDSMTTGVPVLPRKIDALIEREAREKLGSVPEVLRYVAGSPWIPGAIIAWLGARYAYATPDDANVACLAAAQENACRHCYGALRTILRLLGYSETTILRFERERQAAELGDHGRAVVDFARALARSNPRPARPEFEALLDAGLSRGAAGEIAWSVAMTCMTNRIATLLAIPPDAAFEALPDRWFVRLLRPLVERKVRGKPASPPPAAYPAPDIPFGAVIPMIGPIPGAALLSRMLEDAFRSDMLPRRTKVLVFAVVAHAIGCALCETEAKRALAADGIDAENAARILEHLASPLLDPVEALLVPFVRETVRYRPAAIQERTRSLLRELGPDRLLEAVGVSALANTVVRLGMLAEC